MLELGKEKAKTLDYGSSRIQFHQMDAESLPFVDNSVVYLSMLSLIRPYFEVGN